MSSVVENITTAIENRIASLLPTWKELSYKLDISLNPKIGGYAYGVVPRQGSTVPGVNGRYTVDQEYELILVGEYFGPKRTDDKQRAVNFELFKRLHEIYNSLKKSRPNIVLNVSEMNFSDPEDLEENNLMVLRANLLIKYQENI